MTADNVKKIVVKVIKEGSCTGFWLMNHLPKTVRNIVKAGEQMASDQQLRGVRGTVGDKDYVSFLVDGVNIVDGKNELFAGLWEVSRDMGGSYPGTFTKAVWKGYCKLG